MLPLAEIDGLQHPALVTSFDSRRARVPAIFIGVALATLAW
jgi:hypothetical protein